MKSGVTFDVNQTFLELNIKTVLQRSPEQLKQLGTCFKMSKKSPHLASVVC